jgi:hypothetical protein
MSTISIASPSVSAARIMLLDNASWRHPCSAGPTPARLASFFIVAAGKNRASVSTPF